MTRLPKTTSKLAEKHDPGVGARIIEGLEEAIAWSKGEHVAARVTEVPISDRDVVEVRRQPVLR